MALAANVGRQRVVSTMKKLFPRDRVEIKVDKSASAERREAAVERLFEIADRIAEIHKQRKALGYGRPQELLQLARFVVDTDGDVTAVEELAKVVKQAEANRDLEEERAALRNEESVCEDEICRCKYSAILGPTTIARDDTLEGLLIQIKRHSQLCW